MDGNFQVLGYSIGGNYALALSVAFPKKVDKLWLLAADGLKFKLGFWFVTRTWLGKWFFKGFVHFPGPIFLGIRVLSKMGFYPDKLVQFFMTNIATKDKRESIYQRWRSVSIMLRKNKEILARINKYSVPVEMFFGRFDKIIPLRNAINFAKKIDRVNLVILEDGHQILHSKTYKKMKEVL